MPASHITTTNVLEWAIPRLKVYIIAALAGPALLLAGTAFYAYVWPGIPKHEVVWPGIPKHEVDPPPAVPALPSVPIQAPFTVPPAGDSSSGEVASARPEIPPEAKLVGARIVDQNKRMLGLVTHVRRDERGNVANVSVRLDATKQESDVPLGDVRWTWDSKPETKATGLWIMRVPEDRR